MSGANFASAAFFLYSYMFSGLFMTGTQGKLALIRFTSIFYYGWEALVANEFRPGECKEPSQSVVSRKRQTASDRDSVHEFGYLPA